MPPILLPRALFLAGLAAWSGVAFAALALRSVVPISPAWWCIALIWLGFLFLRPRTRREAFGIMATQSLCTIGMVAVLCNFYEGMLFIHVAAQLGLAAPKRVAVAWIVAQSLLHALTITWRWELPPAVILAIPYLGFQLLMFTSVRLFNDERRMREALAAANDTLRVVQAELVGKERIAERLRLAQELHDSLGHNLTALSLNLEFAAHSSEGTVRRMVRSAQALARALLLEVKSIVRRSADDAPVDFVHEMRRMAHDLPRPKVHFRCSEAVDVSDPRIGRVLLRASQEIVTNAIRHSEAENLWIEIRAVPDCISFTARDDGKALDAVTEGYGLAGMRRRFEDLGGSLLACIGDGGGFEVRAELPAPRRAGREAAA